MNLKQIEENLLNLIQNFSAEEFIYDFLLCFGTPKATIARMKKGKLNLAKKAGQIILKRKIFFEVIKDQDLHSAFSTIKNDPATNRHNPRFIIITDYETILAFDTKTKEPPLNIAIKSLSQNAAFFIPLAGQEKYIEPTENPADVKAAGKMAKIYDEILENLNKNLKLQNKIPYFYYDFRELCADCFESGIVKILRKICHFTFKLDAVENLSEDEIKTLKQIVLKIEDCELKSRIADILFIKEKHQDWANMEIESMLESGKSFLDSSAKISFARAIQIGLEIKNNKILLEIAEYLKTLLVDTSFNAENGYVLGILELLCLTKQESGFCVEFIEQNFDKIKSNHDKARILDYAVAVATQEKKNDLRLLKAKSFKQESDQFAQEKNYLVAAYWLKIALNALKEINQKSEEKTRLKKEWQKLLTTYNRKIQEFNMQPIIIQPTSQQVSDAKNNNDKNLEAIKRIGEDYGVIGTLIKLTSIPVLTTRNSRKREKSISDYCGKSFLDGEKEVPDSEKNRESHDSLLFLDYYISFSGIGVSAKYIVDNFDQRDIETAIFQLLKNSNLVPQEKIKQFFIAIKSGFDGIRYGVLENWIVCSHIIPAQIESIFRIYLKRIDKYELKTDEKTQTQQDLLLGDMLSGEYRNELDKFFGEDLIFSLGVVLNNQAGGNLRNKIYHGLCDDQFFNNSLNFYLWWLFVKIILTNSWSKFSE